MSFKIPLEYETGFDFGFSAVDSDEPIGTLPLVPVQPSIDTSEISAPILAAIENLAVTVANLTTSSHELATKITRLEASNLDGDKSADLTEYKALIQNEAKNRLKTLESLIIPLLVNLLKNEDKEYIKWPNRGPIIRAQMEKIMAITRADVA